MQSRDWFLHRGSQLLCADSQKRHRCRRGLHTASMAHHSCGFVKGYGLAPQLQRKRGIANGQSTEEGRSASKLDGLLEGDLCCCASPLAEGGGRGRTSNQTPDLCGAGVKMPGQGEGPAREGHLLVPDTQMHGCFSPEWVEKPPFPQKCHLTDSKEVGRSVLPQKKGVHSLILPKFFDYI